ncbi:MULTISPECIES: hypothetical protein [Kribbella]|uniref:hypothetical protein n=1 Tax=Kribbella TaxID=182639 RepID=UPI001053C0AC|nr:MULTISPECIES: hypothetical protein [Kribbella]
MPGNVIAKAIDITVIETSNERITDCRYKTDGWNDTSDLTLSVSYSSQLLADAFAKGRDFTRDGKADPLSGYPAKVQVWDAPGQLWTVVYLPDAGLIMTCQASYPGSPEVRLDRQHLLCRWAATHIQGYIPQG